MLNSHHIKKNIVLWDLSLLFLFAGLILYVLFALYINWIILFFLVLSIGASFLFYRYSTKQLMITKHCHLLQCLFFEQAYNKLKKKRQVGVFVHKHIDLFAFAQYFGFSCDLSKDEIRALHIGAKEYAKTLHFSSFQNLLILVFGMF